MQQVRQATHTNRRLISLNTRRIFASHRAAVCRADRNVDRSLAAQPMADTTSFSFSSVHYTSAAIINDAQDYGRTRYIVK